MFFSPIRINRSALNGFAYVPQGWPHAEAVDRVLHDALDTSSPRSQVNSDEHSITLSIDVPGLAKDQLTIGLEGRVLRISSKDDAPRSFKVVYKLGSDVDPTSSLAKLEHGVLSITLRKVSPESRQVLLPIS